MSFMCSIYTMVVFCFSDFSPILSEMMPDDINTCLLYKQKDLLLIYFCVVACMQKFILAVCVCLVAQPCWTLCDPMNCNLPGFSVHRDSPGKNTGLGCHALLQGITLTQGLNPCLLRSTCIDRWILYH